MVGTCSMRERADISVVQFQVCQRTDNAVEHKGALDGFNDMRRCAALGSSHNKFVIALENRDGMIRIATL